jgi:hypothetical protein
MNTRLVDVLIIGGGPAGLYTALHLSRFFHRIVLCEKDNVFGGRTRMLRLSEGLRTTCGAGVVREHDTLLRTLCSDLGIELDFHPSVIRGLDGRQIHPTRVNKMMSQMMAVLQQRSAESHVTFREFCARYMPRGFLQRLVRWCGYTDYLEADARDTILSYGFTDCTEDLRSSRVDWDLLITRMVTEARRRNVVLMRSTAVENISRTGRAFTCRVAGKEVHTERVVVATTADVYAHIFPGSRLDTISRNIGWQPFLRLVVRVAPPRDPPLITSMTYTDNEYQKMYPISKGYYCVSYSDNENAVRVAAKSKKEIQQDVRRILGRPVVLTRVLRCFHTVGTHFFRPLPPSFRSRADFVDAVQNPSEGLFVVGEAVALDQGWTEGALQSVERILPFITNKI